MHHPQFQWTYAYKMLVGCLRSVVGEESEIQITENKKL
jgi:hypothetical protein